MEKRFFFENDSISLSDFYNSDTLNIFCDASIIGNSGNFTGCYGIVAVCRDNVIDSLCRIVSNTTNNNSELKGLRAAISMANKWKYNFKYINIFCDSQISVFGLRDYIYKWKYNPNTESLYGTANTPIKNQEIFIECHYMLQDLLQIQNICIRLFHQSGHVGNNYNSLKEASRIFRYSNNIKGNIDLNFIRYIL